MNPDYSILIFFIYHIMVLVCFSIPFNNANRNQKRTHFGILITQWQAIYIAASEIILFLLLVASSNYSVWSGRFIEGNIGICFRSSGLYILFLQIFDHPISRVTLQNKGWMLLPLALLSDYVVLFIATLFVRFQKTHH